MTDEILIDEKLVGAFKYGQALSLLSIGLIGLVFLRALTFGLLAKTFLPLIVGPAMMLLISLRTMKMFSTGCHCWKQCSVPAVFSTWLPLVPDGADGSAQEPSPQR